LSAAPAAAALEKEERLDILEAVPDDDVELEETDKEDDGKSRTILIECKVWVTCNRAVISNPFDSDQVGKGEGADSPSSAMLPALKEERTYKALLDAVEAKLGAHGASKQIFTFSFT
jgi:hypothetical protein